MSYFYPFIYFQRLRKDRQLKMASHVDVTALMLVADALYALGWSLGEIELNHPPIGETTPSQRFGIASFEPGALIVSATRPDLEKKGAEPMACKKTTQKGFTPLEVYIEAAWRMVLALCVRLKVEVHDFATPYFEQGYASRRNIDFIARGGAPYMGLPDDLKFRRDSFVRTAAYVLRLRELWPGGPGYLGFFGMDSVTALIWSQLLRRRHIDLLQNEGFYIAELCGPLPDRAPDLRWTLGWESRVILRAPVNPPQPPTFSLAQESSQSANA